jgi:exodeoxyribonuclease-1
VDATPKIIRSLSINKTPALLAVPAPTDQQLRRAAAIANAPEFRARVAAALAARFPEDPSAPPPHVEKQIFSGFYSNADKALLAEFQRVDWPRRQEIAATFNDPRLRQLGRRLVASHAPQLLTTEELAKYQLWLRERWSAPEVVRFV